MSLLTLESSDGVDVQAVWRVANLVTVFEMASPHVEVDIAFPGMVASIQVCELCEERAGILGIWVEVNTVDEVGNKVNKEEGCQSR